jgi:hypothetical protein
MDKGAEPLGTQSDDRRGAFMKRRDAATRVLLAGGTAALTIYAYLLFRSGWSEPQLYSSWAAAVRYSPIATFAASLYLAARLRSAGQVVLALVSVGLVLILYAAELVLAASNAGIGLAPSEPLFGVDRAAPSTKKKVAAAATRFGADVDLRDRADVLAEMHARGIAAVPAMMVSGFLDRQPIPAIKPDALMPLSGIANTVTVLCNEGSAQYVSYLSDEHGFRNPTGIWESAPVDLAVLGQSHVQGYCVRDGETFVDVLRKHDRRVLNLGMSGVGALLQLAVIREYLHRLAPRVVLWCYSEGLETDLEIEATWPALMRYLDPSFSQQLLMRQTEIDSVLRTYLPNIEMRARNRQPISMTTMVVRRSVDVVKLSNLRHKVDLVYGSGDSGPGTKASDDLFKNILKQAQAETAAWGGHLYMVYLPNWTRYRNGPRPSEHERTRITTIARDLAIPVIDVTPQFEAQGDPLSLFPLRIFGHYNKAGSRLVAETITNYLNAVTHSASEP